MFGFPHHIDLTVRSLEKSVEFYGSVLGELGFEPTHVYGGGAPCWAYLRISEAVFSIALKEAHVADAHNRYAPGLHHLALNADSRDAVDNFYQFLVESGRKILDTPAEYDYTPGYYAVFFADPDGIKLEVVYEPQSATPDV